MYSNKLIIIPASIAIICLFVLGVPIINVEETEFYTVSTPFNVTVPYEVKVPYETEVPYIVNETFSEIFKYAKYDSLNPNYIYYYNLNLYENEHVNFTIRVQDDKQFTSYIVGSADFANWGLVQPYHVARTFFGSGTLEYTCTFDDTYYFMWETREDNNITLQKVEIIKSWQEKLTKCKKITKYRNETKYWSKIEYRDITHNRTVTKKVTILSKFMNTYS